MLQTAQIVHNCTVKILSSWDY